MMTRRCLYEFRPHTNNDVGVDDYIFSNVDKTFSTVYFIPITGNFRQKREKSSNKHFVYLKNRPICKAMEFYNKLHWFHQNVHKYNYHIRLLQLELHSVLVHQTSTRVHTHPHHRPSVFRSIC